MMLFPGPYYVIKGLYFVFTQYCVVSVFITLHILLLPLRFTAPALYWKIDALLFKASLGLVSSWFYTEGVTLKESGDSLKDIYNDEVLLLCNHQSTADIGVMMQSMYSKGPTAGHLIWIMDHVFRLTHFGWMSCFHGDFFLEKPRSEAKRNEQMRNMKEHIRSAYSDGMKKWVVLFPEGGFLCNMRPSSQRYANQHGLPILNNVCLPRLVATQTIIDELTPKEGSSDLKKCRNLKWIVDTTIAYPRGEAPNGLYLIFSRGKFPPIRVHYRVFDIKSVPRDEEGFKNWMYDRYIEKEAMLERFYKTGSLVDNLTESIDTDVKGAFFSVLFYFVMAVCFSVFLYFPVISLVNFKWILLIVLIYMIYFAYSFVKTFF
eukprot:XP_011444060.1 PREDICTED: acyl-CoA:lysophosphatidylglycerol acyltransferase 1-like isoform X1 [Crassostrea gigas]